MKQSDISYQDAPAALFERADALISRHADELEHYLERLLWWNQRVNLVSRSVPRETLREHIRHSLLVSGLASFEKAAVVVDGGTGGGLPGLPLAITHPRKSFVLNDIVSKKILSVRQMARNLDLANVMALDGSLSDLDREEPFLLLSKHSFKLDEILELSDSLPWSEMVLYKGEEIGGELQSLPPSRAVHVSVLRLENTSGDPFYKGKGLVNLSRKST